jgi:hypothetical protein
MENVESKLSDERVPDESLQAGQPEKDKLIPGQEKYAKVEKEIQETQAELGANVEELGKDTDKLEELEKGSDGLTTKAKKVLNAGLTEIKDFVLANPTINMLAEIYMVSGAVRGVYDGKSMTEIATQVFGEAVAFGAIKAVSYLGWGRKERQRRIELLEHKNEGNYTENTETGEKDVGSKENDIAKQPEVTISAENVEGQIKDLKNSLEKAYGDDEQK